MTDAERTTKNHVSYVYSREVILKELLKDGTISREDFERYDLMLYDRYHIDGSLGLPRPAISFTDTTLLSPNKSVADDLLDYISLTSMAREKNPENPGYEIQSWLRNSNTAAFLRLWELRNNPVFDDVGYSRLMDEMGKTTSTFTTKKWIDATGAIGLRSERGQSGGTYAHPEIACAFKMWLSPDFQFELTQNYMRMGHWQEALVK